MGLLVNNTDKENDIPEKWKINCPLDHSTFEKFTNCDCNYGGARDVWWFKEQQIHSLKAELEKARELIKLMKDNMVYIEPEYDELSIKVNEFLKKEEVNGDS